MNWTAAGAWALAVGVMIGAFGAHGLQGRLDAYSINIYERAVLYHYVHALGVLLTSALAAAGAISRRAESWAAGLLLAGVVLFCGSLYALALSGNRMLGAITPFGGVCFIAGWIVLAISSARARRPKQ